MVSFTFPCFLKCRRVDNFRNLYRSRGFGIQLYVPLENRRTTLQLEASKFHFTFQVSIAILILFSHQENTGLIAVANAVGYFCAIPFTFTSDRLAAHLTVKNNHIREAEMRLPVLLPAMIIAPAGLVVYGLTAQNNLHWMGYMAGVSMVNWGAYFYFSFTLAYAVDSYNANTSEMLIAMNLGKQAISFGMGLKLLDWILERGYAVVISGIFCALLLANNLALGIFWFYGKKIRIFTSRSWLGGMHRKTQGERLTH